MSSNWPPAAQACALGVVAGIRSASGPAIFTRLAARDPAALAGTPWALFADPRVRTLITLGAAGEMVIDKLPFLPPRTDPLPLAARLLSGATIGAGALRLAGESWAPGALLGALGALAGSYAGFYGREALAQRVGLPEPIGGFVGDALVLGAARLLLGGR